LERQTERNVERRAEHSSASVNSQQCPEPSLAMSPAVTSVLGDREEHTSIMEPALYLRLQPSEIDAVNANVRELMVSSSSGDVSSSASIQEDLLDIGQELAKDPLIQQKVMAQIATRFRNNKRLGNSNTTCEENKKTGGEIDELKRQIDVLTEGSGHFSPPPPQQTTLAEFPAFVEPPILFYINLPLAQHSSHLHRQPHV
jgi:hypothetical protein